MGFWHTIWHTVVYSRFCLFPSGLYSPVPLETIADRGFCRYITSLFLDVDGLKNSRGMWNPWDLHLLILFRWCLLYPVRIFRYLVAYIQAFSEPPFTESRFCYMLCIRKQGALRAPFLKGKHRDLNPNLVLLCAPKLTPSLASQTDFPFHMIC